jgi:hypothetical protein
MPAYETVPIVDQTPPSGYPSIEEEGVSPVTTGVVGAAAGLAVGVAGAVAAQQLTKKEE